MSNLPVGPPFDCPGEFWPLVKKARERANMGPVQLARELGTTHQRLRRLEEGNEGKEMWKPAARRAFAIAAAEALGCPRSALGLPPAPNAPGEDAVAELRDRLETLEQRTLPRLRTELMSEIVRELRLQEAQRKQPKPGDQGEGVTGG